MSAIPAPAGCGIPPACPIEFCAQLRTTLRHRAASIAAALAAATLAAATLAAVAVILAAFILAAVLVPLPAVAQEEEGGLAVGDTAPDFSLKGSDGETYTLAQFKGEKNVILAFFPKAFTGG